MLAAPQMICNVLSATAALPTIAPHRAHTPCFQCCEIHASDSSAFCSITSEGHVSLTPFVAYTLNKKHGFLVSDALLSVVYANSQVIFCLVLCVRPPYSDELLSLSIVVVSVHRVLG